MRIGFDAKRAFANETGLGNYSRFVIESLLQYAPENEYYAYNSVANKNLRFIRKGLFIRNPYLNALSKLWRSKLIINDLKGDSINIFHGLSNELPWGMHRLGIKSIVTIHDLIFLRYPELYPIIDRFFYKIKFRNACRQADIIVAISEQTKRDIISFFHIAPEKIKVVYQDTDKRFQNVLSLDTITKVKAENNISQPYILSVGTLEPRKNQLLLVKAFEKLSRSDLSLILIGRKTNYQTEIEAYIQHQNIKNIQILNHVTFEHLPAIYQGATLFVYPSKFEGFGIPIIEALHSGVPVIAAKGSCLEEAGGEGAFYVSPINCDELFETINKLLNNTLLQKELINKGRQHVKLFSAKNISESLINIYKELLADKALK